MIKILHLFRYISQLSKSSILTSEIWVCIKNNNNKHRFLPFKSKKERVGIYFLNKNLNKYIKKLKHATYLSIYVIQIQNQFFLTMLEKIQLTLERGCQNDDRITSRFILYCKDSDKNTLYQQSFQYIKYPQQGHQSQRKEYTVSIEISMVTSNASSSTSNGGTRTRPLSFNHSLNPSKWF